MKAILFAVFLFSISVHAEEITSQPNEADLECLEADAKSGETFDRLTPIPEDLPSLEDTELLLGHIEGLQENSLKEFTKRYQELDENISLLGFKKKPLFNQLQYYAKPIVDSKGHPENILPKDVQFRRSGKVENDGNQVKADLYKYLFFETDLVKLQETMNEGETSQSINIHPWMSRNYPTDIIYFKLTTFSVTKVQGNLVKGPEVTMLLYVQQMSLDADKKIGIISREIDLEANSEYLNITPHKELKSFSSLTTLHDDYLAHYQWREDFIQKLRTPNCHIQTEIAEENVDPYVAGVDLSRNYTIYMNEDLQWHLSVPKLRKYQSLDSN